MASEAEAERYRQLLRMEMDGRIQNLRTQVTHPLMVNNQLICRYRSDFEYQIIDEHGRITGDRVEDVKGFETPDFKLKKKLFDALEPTPLTVIPAKGKAKHPDRMDQPSSRAGWMHKHWADKLPD